MHKSNFSLVSLLDEAYSLKTDAIMHTLTKPKQNQTEISSFVSVLWTITLGLEYKQAHTSVIHVIMPLPWEGLLQRPQPAFLTDSYKKKKKTHYKTMSSRENEANFLDRQLGIPLFPQ